MAIICPGCTTQLSPEATSCYVCMRPRTRNEIFKGIHGEQLEVKSQRRRPFIIAACLLAAAAGGYAWFKLKPAPRVPPAPVASTASPSVQQQQSGFSSPGSNLGSPSERVEMFPREQVRQAPSTQAPPDAPVDRPVEPSYSSAPPPELYKAKETPTKWKVSGRIYDLISLRPVAGASVSFTDGETGKTRAVKTGKDGRYSLVLPPLKEGGYAPNVSHPAYRPGFLEEGDVPFMEQGESRRIEASQLLRENVIMHVPVTPAEGKGQLTYDAVLTPVPR